MFGIEIITKTNMIVFYSPSNTPINGDDSSLVTTHQQKFPVSINFIESVLANKYVKGK